MQNRNFQTHLLGLFTISYSFEKSYTNALENGSYISKVQADIDEAQQVGVNGVPFFVFNRKYAVSGAQDPKAFLEILQKAFAEWRKVNPETKLEILEGKACTPDKECK